MLIKLSETFITSIVNSYSIILIITTICFSFASCLKLGHPNIKFPNCKNVEGLEIMEGNDFIPPENPCIHCMCFKGEGKFCESIECDNPPPLGCKKWTEYCCNYTCHDGEYNEFDHFDVNGGYDSHENTPFNRFKKYAGQLWNRVIYGKRNVSTPSYDSNHLNETLSDDSESTTISDIPFDITLKPLEQTLEVTEGLIKLHNVRNCRDMYDIEVKEGQFYTPGPNACNLCRCINRRPRFCKPIECQAEPPENCKNWTQECCEYTCHDIKDSKEDFFLNRWIDKFIKKTTMAPSDDPYYATPM